MSKIALYPGTFDPITNGHLDLVYRAAQIFDEVIIAVSDNPRKNPLFDIHERLQMVEEVTRMVANKRVISFDDLLVNMVRREGARFVIRGLRAVSDFDYEFQLANMNRRLNPDLESVFLTPAEKNSFISSTLVKEVARHNGDVSEFVDPIVAKALQEKIRG